MNFTGLMNGLCWCVFRAEESADEDDEECETLLLVAVVVAVDAATAVTAAERLREDDEDCAFLRAEFDCCSRSTSRCKRRICSLTAFFCDLVSMEAPFWLFTVRMETASGDLAVVGGTSGGSGSGSGSDAVEVVVPAGNGNVPFSAARSVVGSIFSIDILG